MPEFHETWYGHNAKQITAPCTFLISYHQ